jgi:hypothetical protein
MREGDEAKEAKEGAGNEAREKGRGVGEMEFAEKERQRENGGESETKRDGFNPAQQRQQRNREKYFYINKQSMYYFFSRPHIPFYHLTPS